MTLNIKATHKETTVIPEGTHIATLYSIVDLGTQEVIWQGEVKYYPKVRLTFELPDELKEFDGVKKPLVIGNEYTMSLSDKAKLKPVIEGILGKALTPEERANYSSDDFSALVGTHCMLSVVHTEKDGVTYANIASVSPLHKSIPKPTQYNPSMIYDISEGQSDKFKELPEFMRNKILKAREMRPISDESKQKLQELRKNTVVNNETNPDYPTEDINPEDIPF